MEPSLAIAGIVAAMLALHLLGRLWTFRRSKRWLAAARDLGLHAGGPPTANKHHAFPRMSGKRGGWPIDIKRRVSRRTVEYRDKKGRRRNRTVTSTYTQVLLELKAALPRGVVRSVGGVDRLLASVKDQKDFDLGAPDVERAFDFTTMGPNREILRAAMAQRPVLAALRRLAESDGRFTAMGNALKIEFDGIETGELREATEALIDFANALGPALARAWEEGVENVCATVWPTVASRQRLDQEGHRLAGAIGAIEVEAFTSLDDGFRYTEVRARLQDAPWERLTLAPAHGVDGLLRLVGVRDMEIGEAAFDHRFQIEGAPEVAVKAALSDGARRRLTKLANDAHVRIADDELSARRDYLVVDADELEAWLIECRDVAAALLGRADGGPYR